MANQWTKEQQQAIERSGRNILVSAAAGSGKTAVLVERIIQKITGSEEIDIDKCVVVTFTKAAAAEMKQRIRDSIDDFLEKDPDNIRLQKQLTLINNAQITTIDSFCLNIIRNYFTDIDLDPGFRTADEGEIKLLEADVMENMLEEYYENGTKEFLDLVDAYGTGRNDENIEEIILKLYRFARSHPWPDEWFEEAVSIYDIEDENSFENNTVIKYLMEYVERRFVDFEKIYQHLLNVCNEPDGPAMYTAAIQSDYNALQMIKNVDSFSKMAKLIQASSFDTLGRKKINDVSEEKKAYVKAHRDKYKDFVNKVLKGKIFTKDLPEMIKDVQDNKSAVCMMIELAREFSKRMQEQKKDRNIIDFNDMEHMALNVLIHHENGKSTYTDASDTLSEFYSEILIDEYQDSNMLQEVILKAVSKGRYDSSKNNIYMVGDVKQSIYRFRMACPQLFMEKYNSYTETESQNEKIELQANFRSRKNVLDCVNDVFRYAMNKEFTGVGYENKAMLNAGFDYSESEKNLNKDTCITFGNENASEIILVTTGNEVKSDINEQSETIKSSENDNSVPEKTSKEAQAAAVAKRIKELVEGKDGKPYMVYDKKCSEGYRKIKYSDIVILLRTVNGWADVFVNELMNSGIPAYCDATKGYFNVREVKLIINYLTVIDNPLQDIPMSAVMLSYFGGFDTDELAEIKLLDKNLCIYQIMSKILASEELKGRISVDTIKKIQVFAENLNKFREKSELMAINSLMWEIMYNTGYYDYVGSMPAGNARQANLDMLLEKASSFENTSYNGLFNFLRYIERMQQFEVDFGEASVLGENENLVRVMSIHKSKGLEFPVVFLSGMNKKINLLDATGDVVVDQTFGVGTNVVNLDKRIKVPTYIKAAVGMKIIQESISEELRVLYVAMTRAREKLIMVGSLTAKEKEKQISKWQEKSQELIKSKMYSYSDVAEFGNYFDVVMPVAYMDMQNAENQNDEDAVKCILQSEQTGKRNNEGVFCIIEHNVENEILCENKENNGEVSNDSPGEDEKQELSDDKHNAVIENIPPYPYNTDISLKSKVTVSELKKMQMESDMDQKYFESEELKSASEKVKTDECEEIIPVFIKGAQQTLIAGERGTAYHRVMECLNYSKSDSLENVKSDMEDMLNTRKMTKDQYNCIDAEKIYAFCKSDIGKRAKKAWENKKIYREQPFVFVDMKEKNELLIQGVIDMYLVENEEVVIIDYKTDRVKKGKQGEEELIKRYKVQLEYYAKAIEQITGMHVKEKIIYSFELEKAIEL